MTTTHEDETAAATMTPEDGAHGDPGTESGSEVTPPASALPVEPRLEALLVSSERPLTEARIAELLELAAAGDAPSPRQQVRDAIETLNAAYDADGRSFRIERLAGGWQILTRPEFGTLLRKLHRDRQQSRLSQAALETLAIIAYRQPILRAEVEAIRGVSCGEVLRSLLERRLVKIVGRSEELGRPMLYGTTREFLKVFGLASPEDLPEVEGLAPDTRRRRRAKTPETPPEAAASADPVADEPAEAPDVPTAETPPSPADDAAPAF